MEQKDSTLKGAPKYRKNWSLRQAAERGDIKGVQQALSSGADINSRDLDGWNPVHYAAMRGHLKIIQLLEEKGINLKETTSFGDTSLSFACEYGRLPVIEYLISKGLSMKTPNMGEMTPLDLLRRSSEISVGRRQECLKALKIDDNDVDDNNVTDQGSPCSQTDTAKDVQEKLDSERTKNGGDESTLSSLTDPTEDVKEKESSKEKPKEYQKWLDKATDEGTVDTQWSNVSVAGASGTGKTSVINLLLLNDPVTVHHSTAVLENYDVCVAEEEETKEEADSSVSGSDTSGSELLPESDPECQPDSTQPTIEEERKMSQHMFFADDGKDHLWKVAEKDTLHKKLAEAIVTLMNSEEDEAEAETIPKPQHCKFSPCYPSAEPSAVPPDTSAFKSTINTAPAEAPNSIKLILELLPLLVTQEAELGRIHLINMLDSGGQASFIDIAPALFRYNSVNLIFHKLNEQLSASANFFYCINGMRIGEEKRIISNKQLLKTLFSSSMGVKKPDLEGLSGMKIVGEAHILVIGTHYDIYCEMKKEGKLEETLVQKNELLSSELSEFNDWIVDYQLLKGHGKKKASSVEYIFPINALSRDKRELRIAQKIRQLASRCYIKAKVPVRWYLIQIEINELKASGEDMVIIGKVLKIGFIFHMSEKEVRASLKYFHDLTVCLYFHEVLPNVVFLTPKRLFKKLSEIVAVSLKEHTHLVKESISKPLCEKGVFTKALLDFFPDDYKEGLFTPDDLLVLMEHLLIITRLPDSDCYFMPSVLECLEDPLESLEEAFFAVAPLCFSWNDAVPNGLFPSLLQYLQGHHEPDFVANMNAKNYRNKVSLKFLEGIEKVVKVVLFELPGFIGVAHSGHPKDCPPIRTAICNGIAYIVKTFSWKEELAKPQESFLCTMEHAIQLPPHMCRINKRREYLTCSMDYQKQAKRDDIHHMAWRDESKEEKNQERNSQKNDIVSVQSLSSEKSDEYSSVFSEPNVPFCYEVLIQQRPKHQDIYRLVVTHSLHWNELAIQLGLEFNFRQELYTKYSSNSERLDAVIAQWMLSAQGAVTWMALLEAMDKAELKEVTKKIKEYLQSAEALKSYGYSLV